MEGSVIRPYVCPHGPHTSREQFLAAALSLQGAPAVEVPARKVGTVISRLVVERLPVRAVQQPDCYAHQQDLQ